MRAVVQRVSQASVTLAAKIYHLRILEGELGARVETGVFGASMQVSLVNDGPVTLILEA